MWKRFWNKIKTLDVRRKKYEIQKARPFLSDDERACPEFSKGIRVRVSRIAILQ